MRRGEDTKYIRQMYWLPADRLQERVQQYELFPVWVYYDSYSARYFVEEMQMQGFTMIRCVQSAKTLSLPMQMLGADLQAHKVNYNNNPILKWCLMNKGIRLTAV